jgi:hypothetical protein
VLQQQQLPHQQHQQQQQQQQALHLPSSGASGPLGWFCLGLMMTGTKQPAAPGSQNCGIVARS